MAVKNWRTKHDELRGEAIKAWKWLRRLPTYRNAYAEFHAAVQQEVEKERQLRLLYQTPQDSNYYRLLPLDETLLPELSATLKRQWGFFPLEDPRKFTSSCPPQLAIDIANLFDQLLYQDAVAMTNLNPIVLSELVYDKKLKRWTKQDNPNLPSLPKRLIFEVDPRKPLQLILKLLESSLKEVRRVYGIKDKRPRPKDLCVRYQTYVLQQSGQSQGKIAKALYSKEALEAAPEAYKQRVKRMQKHPEPGRKS